VITLRSITLVRVPDLQSLHAGLVTLTRMDDGVAARECAVIVPTRGAAESLRRTLENRSLSPETPSLVLPDILTRTDFYARLHQTLGDAPGILSEFEREVLVRRAARAASEAGAAAPFRLRAGLILEILALYDELARRGRTVDDFDRLMTASLEPGADTDRGAERMLRQTRFLVAVFRDLERRIAETGRIDEHGLRARLLASNSRPAYRHVVVTVGDRAADACGLWPADYDMLSRMPGLERIDIVATEHLLRSGLHQRMMETFPGMEERRLDAPASVPVLAAPENAGAQTDIRWFVSRDREEELSDFARAIKPAPVSDRTAFVFQRPLPYLYLARSVFPEAGVPWQALDARPLAAEPFAAALDLVFEVARSEATRGALVDLLASPQWSFAPPADAAEDRAAVPVGVSAIGRADVSALDAFLHEVKYLGGWDLLASLAVAEAPVHTRAERLWRRARPALLAAAAAGKEIQAIVDAPAASAQVALLVAFVKRHEHPPGDRDPSLAAHRRARAAILGALGSLAEAHAAHDDEPLLVTDLTGTIRRWIEGQTFSERTGTNGVQLLDARAAAYADVDDVRLGGLVESDWPEGSRRSIFYPASLLAQLGWPGERERLAAARARFLDLLHLARTRVSLSTFILEDDALVPPSAFLEEIAACSLPIERVARQAPRRVFAHEALSEEPLAPAAVAGIRAEWLALRTSRSPGSHAAYHGSAGPIASRASAVSHVERYLDCPFKYFSSYVLGLEEERDEDAGLSPQERGQFLHEVFQQFFTRWEAAGARAITAGNLDEAVALFEEVAETSLAALPAAERDLERLYLLGSAAAPGLAERAFGFEIEQDVGIVERLLEHKLEGEFVLAGADGPVTLPLRGKADRIDLLDDGTLRVVDYKLGRAPKSHRALQLPVYGVCASQQLEGHHGRSWPVSRAGYVAFREKNAFSSIGSSQAEVQKALVDGQARMVAAVGRISKGEFPVDPDEPFFCTRCGYASVCRKDYVGDE
jgi:RecB family exonuclease